jgi:hypothetical protein
MAAIAAPIVTKNVAVLITGAHRRHPVQRPVRQTAIDLKRDPNIWPTPPMGSKKTALIPTRARAWEGTTAVIATIQIRTAVRPNNPSPPWIETGRRGSRDNRLKR